MQYEMRGRGQHRRHIYKMCFATVDKPSINVYYLSDMLVMNISTCFTKSMLESLDLKVAKVMREVGGECEQMKMSSPPLSTLSENVKMSLLHFNQNVLHRTLWRFSLFSRSIADALVSDGPDDLHKKWVGLQCQAYACIVIRSNLLPNETENCFSIRSWGRVTRAAFSSYTPQSS